MAQKPLSILISGAGIAGSSLALMLARHPSFTLKPIVTLVERAPEPRTTGQAIDIRGQAVTVIQRLGLEKKIKEKHTSETGIAFVDAEGRTIAQVDATGNVNKQSGTSEFEILRGDLAALLIEEMEAAKKANNAEVSVVYGESVKSLEEQEDGVAVQFAQGKVKDAKFDVVVAADGYHSSTRAFIFNKEASESAIMPMGMYIAYYTIPRIPEDDDLWQWYTAPGGLAIHLRPHGNKKTMGVYLSITGPSKANIPELDEALAQGPDAQVALLRERFQHLDWQSKRFLDGLDTTNDLYMQSVSMVVTPQWTTNRCAMIGDAAFAMMGFGTSFAMIGAYTLAGELSKITSNSTADVSAALKSHEQVLRPLVAKQQKPPPFFPQTFNPQTQLGLTALRTAIRVVIGLRIPQLAQWFMAGDDKNGWKLPEYGWQQEQAIEASKDKV
ncbi:FAD/NAD(P)-binding domain-containing protein [Ophiobolus disseminans]|uniref:FAD/NAD(P)-binding domain-containing protein n=1 Tax=Ophiobolus disseminans TaxID=1469910 RepID=A0A6A7A8C9_9PLEO|nr:FAD/NAD(P)-binding domain-containing protein [Ophiobolus disseminans]